MHADRFTTKRGLTLTRSGCLSFRSLVSRLEQLWVLRTRGVGAENVIHEF